MPYGQGTTMLAFVDEKTLTKVAEVFGEEEATKIIGVLKEVDEITDDQIARKQRYGLISSVESSINCMIINSLRIGEHETKILDGLFTIGNLFLIE